MAMRDMYEFFKTAISAIGIDIALLLPTILIGMMLAIIFNGTTPPDFQTSNFASIFSVLAIIALAAAGLNRLSNGDFFRGAEYSIFEFLSVKKFPVLALIYLLVFSIVGFAVVGGGTVLISGFQRTPSSVVAAPTFVFTTFFSPIVEEATFRGFLQPLLELLIFPIALVVFQGNEVAARIGAFLVAAVLQGLTFAFVHISAFNGDPNTLLTSVLFGMMMAAVCSVFGLLAAIGWHMGNNLAATIIRAAPSPIIMGGG